MCGGYLRADPLVLTAHHLPFMADPFMADHIPRVIWALWLQGRSEAPGVVEACLASWEKMNPGWEVVVLDEKTAGDYVDADAIVRSNTPYIERQAVSDILRINLLAERGGVWADATCLCMRPLDEWLGEYASSGFFAFERPGADRLISSWFLASASGCALTAAYREAVNAYWSKNTFSGRSPRTNQDAGRLRRALVRRLQKRTRKDSRLPRLWFSFPVRKGLRTYPYYWFHYLFAEVVARNRAAREVWSRTPRLSADGPHRLLAHGLLNPPSDEVRAAVDERREPLYKLTWHLSPDEVPADSTLDYALQAAGVSRDP